MARTRILVADDHEIFRRGLRSLLQSHSEFEVCGEAANGKEAIEAARRLQPDIILMDISMPIVNGLDATQQIRRELSDARVVVLSQHDSSYMLNAAISAGASAYVTKSQVARYLLAALHAVIKGQPFDWTSEGENISSQSKLADIELKDQSD